MIKRCILIFPTLSHSQIIDSIREKYDPLASHVRPHITLVFPFDCHIDSDTLKRHIHAAISDITPFELVLKGITPANGFGRYLFLNVIKGHEEIIEMHKKLYTGVLEDYFPKRLRGQAFQTFFIVKALKPDIW